MVGNSRHYQENKRRIDRARKKNLHNMAENSL
jgi:hypothetical protein